MTTRVIDTEGDREGLLRFIQSQKIPFTVDLTKGRRRSVAQNKLQRLWMNEIAEQLGDRTAEDVRAYCKLHIGVPILRTENDAFCEEYDKWVRPLSYEHKIAFMAVPFDFAVTRLMTVDQKVRYLDEINRRFAEQGLILTQPDDLGRAA